MPNSNEGRKTITIFSAKTLHLLNGLWKKNSSRRGEREREKESKGNGGETRRRSKFETVKIPKNLSYLIPLPLHVRRAFSLFLPPILYALHSSVCPTDSPYDVSGLPYQENYDEDAKPPQQVSLSYDESLESGYSTPNSRGRRIIREIIV